MTVVSPLANVLVGISQESVAMTLVQLVPVKMCHGRSNGCMLTLDSSIGVRIRPSRIPVGRCANSIRITLVNQALNVVGRTVLADETRLRHQDPADPNSSPSCSCSA